MTGLQFATEKKYGSWFEEEVNRQYLKFTEKQKITIFIGTWNVNAKSPKDDISSWIFPPNQPIDQSPENIDMYVLGFQEIVDLNAANLWIENDANLVWEQTIERLLSKNDFCKLATHHLVGILLLVYVRRHLKPFIHGEQTAHCGVGLFGTAGNKGGVGVRMQLYDSTLCFICAHLAAHKNNVQGRNQDYHKIMENLKFVQNGKVNKTNENDNNPSVIVHDTSTVDNAYAIEEWSNMNSHDMIFWLGDLNYRLNFDQIQTVYDLIDTKDYQKLLISDQLMEQKAKKHSFSGFKESLITFQPTYKFQPKTSFYERRVEKKTRFPAYCDRILWRHGHTRTTSITDVQCLTYEISMKQNMSDHKPVYGIFSYAANKFNAEKRLKLRQEIMKNKDKSDNYQRPKIEIEPEVSLPFIKFGELSVKDFIIHNTGQAHVNFRFTHPHNQKSFPEWLKILPDHGMILSHEKESVRFEISITSAEVVRNIPKHGKLEQTCLLRIENTSETVVPTKFVVVTATYLPSCFANKIENLVKYKKPIRFADEMMQTKEVLSIPKELWRMIDHLYKYGMDTEQIFVRPGVLQEVMKVRECLDTGKLFGEVELLSIGQCLVLWFEKLQDPVFSESVCDSFDDNTDITQWCRSALMSMPLSHYNSFIYCVSFLREILKHSSRNKLTVEQLAFCFSSALMQCSMNNVVNLNKHKPFRIMLHFLRNDLF